MRLALRGAVAVVTGAASGIGAELAVQLAAKGTRVALVDRDEAGLHATRSRVADKPLVSVHSIDLTDASAIATLPNAVSSAHGRTSVLINNAGVALAGPFEHYGPGDFEWIMDINFWAGVRLTRAFLPLLSEQSTAQIVYVSSVYGIIGAAGHTAYCASKFAIRGFAEAIRQELRHTPVAITVVHPGGVKTNIARNARAAAGIGNDVARARMAKLEKSLRTAPEKAAEKIIGGIEARKPRVLIGADAYAIDALQRAIPASYGALVRS